MIAPGRTILSQLRLAAPTRNTLVALFGLLLLSCVFDPADLLLGLKLYLFILCWCVGSVWCYLSDSVRGIDARLLIYVLLFIGIPLVSIAEYWDQSGSYPFAGFELYKGYLLISLAALLYIVQIDLMPMLANILAGLSFAIIGTYLAVLAQPLFFAALYLFGRRTGIVLIDNRDYGGGVVILQVYFVTSPMLAISIAHYFRRVRDAKGGGRRLIQLALLMVNVCGMVLAGTRSNIAVALTLPLILWVCFGKHRLFAAVMAVVCGLITMVVFFPQIQALLSPTEFANNIKLNLLDDYRVSLSNPITLFLGQGLGAYQYWTAKGVNFYISELTYLEIFRNFGLFGGVIIMLLLAFPLIYAFVIRRDYPDKHIVFAYLAYLLMCAVNPNLFSSMGILILSIIVANIFRYEAALSAASRGDPHGLIAA